MSRRNISIAVLLTLAAAAASDALPDRNSMAVAHLAPLKLTATPLPLDRDDPAAARVGALRFMGAVQLRSTNALFGGLSGLRAGTGMRMLAASDTGNWVAFDTVERNGWLTGVANAAIAPILRPDGHPAISKADGDAEAVEWNPATGDATISYEQDHRLVHFTGIDASRPETLTRPPVATERIEGAQGWRANGGGEALAVLPGGARIVICEDAARGLWHEAFLTIGAATRRIEVSAPDGLSPTDAVALEDRRVLILYRRFSPLAQQAAVGIADLGPVLAGSAATVDVKIIARWQPPLTLDNMEGMALRRDGGRVFLYLVSDDNLLPVQRTVLMKFELVLP